MIEEEDTLGLCLLNKVINWMIICLSILSSLLFISIATSASPAAPLIPVPCLSSLYNQVPCANGAIDIFGDTLNKFKEKILLYL